MRKPFLTLLAGILCTALAAQKLDKLTVDKIMRDPKWIGTSPSGINWSPDGHTLYFQWNPDQDPSDSLWYITLANKTPVKATVAQKQHFATENNQQYNKAKTAFTVARDGDIYYTELKTGKTKRVTQTADTESNPQFSFNESKIVFNRNQNLYAWDIASGETLQLVNLKSGDAASGPASGGFQGRGGAGGAAAPVAAGNPQEQWLKNDQLANFEVLKDRKKKRDMADSYNKAMPREKELRSINIEDKSVQGLSVSPDGRFVNYRLFRAASATAAKTTIVPSFVTETGFTTDIPSRSKVGAQQGSSDFYIFDRIRDTVYAFKTDSIPGIQDLPAYLSDYPKQLEARKKKPANRAVTVSGVNWSPSGAYLMLDVRAQDNKDRWLLRWDTATGKLFTADRQHDDAWIGGPGTQGFGGGNTGWIDDNTYWFRSEATGYSHLYTYNALTGEKKALTAGNYEVQQAQLSNDRKYFYIQTNEVHPGEQHFYRLGIADGKKEKLTGMTGSNQVTLSPDEKYMAILHSYSNKPWELYLQENALPGSKTKTGAAVQVTNKGQSEEFRSYAWKDPEVITFPAADGAPVYARLYKPVNPHPGKPAVLFVHGAGYLQNAHKWWSSYFREYMFNNMLADNGYYVMDIDYRGSAGYGRDWRTGIYRHMGGKDMSDHVDAVQYLVKNFGVNPQRVGLYGGSYGGFITLMGMFNYPDVFAAGAALRPVTDWANYNHGYTSNILNEPYNDSIAYRKSSPYYFANGLKGNLLICHGMVDVNVHYQDAVKLAQRLIELGKDNWELASYPMEDHGFVEPSSWTDEYKRIFKLFENVLKK